MFIDHIAYRVKSRSKALEILKLLDYDRVEDFPIVFDDGSDALCSSFENEFGPDIFVSGGSEDSVIGRWVKVRDGGGIHHIAFRVDSVKETMLILQAKGWKFTTEEPIVCTDPVLSQVFTQPIEELGFMTIEFIERIPTQSGFCRSSIKRLMESTE